MELLSGRGALKGLKYFISFGQKGQGLSFSQLYSLISFLVVILLFVI